MPAWYKKMWIGSGWSKGNQNQICPGSAEVLSI